jgi:hypothetical protein
MAEDAGDDELVEEELRALLRRLDPVPEIVIAAARALVPQRRFPVPCERRAHDRE